MSLDRGSRCAGANPEIMGGRLAPQRAIDRLSSVGLNTLPAWLRQFHALSNGQRLRAACARNLGSRRAIDDFATTCVKSTSASGRPIILHEVISR